MLGPAAVAFALLVTFLDLAEREGRNCSVQWPPAEAFATGPLRHSDPDCLVLELAGVVDEGHHDRFQWLRRSP